MFLYTTGVAKMWGSCGVLSSTRRWPPIHGPPLTNAHKHSCCIGLIPNHVHGSGRMHLNAFLTRMYAYASATAEARRASCLNRLSMPSLAIVVPIWLLTSASCATPHEAIAARGKDLQDASCSHPRWCHSAHMSYNSISAQRDARRAKEARAISTFFPPMADARMETA